MGLFSKSEPPSEPAPTAIDLAAVDKEKNANGAYLEHAGTATTDATAVGHYIDPALERRVVRKIDMRLIPLVTAMYLLSFLDRSNIGNAKIAGMAKDLKLKGNQYENLLTVFYVSYIVFEFQIMGWKRFKPHYFGAYACLGWGIIATCQAATQTYGGEIALRFLLGVFEAAFGPGIPYLLSFFYLRHEVGKRMGIFLSAAPLATCFAGALAYGITSGHPSIANWRLLFLVEGIPTVCMAAVVFFYLPDSPHQAKFLTEDEVRIAVARGVRQVGTTERVGKIHLKDVLVTFLDVKPWFTALMYFSCNVAFSSLPVFLPTILQEMGFSSVEAQGLSAPPYFLSFLLTIATSFIADKTQQRGLVIMACAIVGGVGYVMLAVTTGVGPRYAGVFLAAAGIFPAIANILPWVTNNQGNDTRRGVGMVMLNVIGQCGPLLGTNLYPTSEKPFYVKGQSVAAAFMFLVAILAFCLRCILVWENKKLDRQYGTLEEQRARLAAAEGNEKDEVEASAGVENYGPMYRYIL